MRGFLFVLTLMAAPAAAQSVTGIVTDPGGKAIPGANVLIQATPFGTTTDAEGRFDLRLPTGSYVVMVGRIGYSHASRSVTVRAGRTEHLEIDLEEATVSLGSVVAVAERSFSAASSNVLRGFDLRNRSLNSSQDLLRLVPGLVIAQHAGGGKAEQIFLRGFDADHGTDVALYVDGMPVNMVSHGHGHGYADLHFLIPEIVEEVDVRKGPYFADAGNLATAGSVTFRTRDRLDENVARIEAGAFGMSRITGVYQIPLNEVEAYAAAQTYRFEGPFDTPQELRRTNLFGKLHADVLSVWAGSFESSWGASGQIPRRAVEQDLISRFGSIDNHEGGSTARRDAHAELETSRFRLRAHVTNYRFRLFSNFTFFLDDPVRGDMIEQVDERLMLGFTGEYRMMHRLSAGAASTRIGTGFRGDDIEVALWKSPSRARVEQISGAVIDERNVYLWIQEEIVPDEKLRIQLGLRADHFTFDVHDRVNDYSRMKRRGVVSPKASVVISPSSTADLFFNVGFGFHSNDARDVVVDRGMPSLPQALGAEIGWRTAIGRRAAVSAAIWMMDLEREFVYVGDAGYTELRGATRRFGADLEARLEPASWLTADADVNVARGYFKDLPSRKNAIPLAPRITASGGLTIHHPKGIEGSLRVRHVGDRPAREDGTVTAEGYTLVDLLIRKRMRNLELSASFENLLDVSWNEAQFDTESRLRHEREPISELHFTPGTPRHLQLGATYFF